MIGLALGGCATDTAELPPSAPPVTGAPPSTAPTSTIESDGESVQSTPIRLVVGDQSVNAILWDNPAGRDLRDRLPLTLTVRDYGGVEKIGRLDQPLTMDAMPDGDDPEIGDLGYYAPNGVFVIYTGDVGYWDGIARIGRVDGDLGMLAGLGDDATITIERG